MADVKWIKIATNIFDDQKIRMIETMPEGDSIIVIWFKLLTLAGKVNDGGFVYFMRDIPYTDQMLSTYLNRPLPIVQLALSTFIKFGMIEIVDDIIFLSNWEKHQNIDKLDKIRDDTRKRVAKHREKKRIEMESVECNVTVTLPVTQCNATEEERRKKIEDRRYKYSTHFEKAWSVYIKKKDKSLAYKAYNARLNNGFSEDELYEATVNYMNECRKKGTPEQYIKNGATFWGVNTPFIDYLPKRDSDNDELQDGYFIFPIDDYYEANPPYFGFPEKWFENGALVKERIKPIRQLPDKMQGTSIPVDYSVEQLLQKYSERREWYERENHTG